MDGPLRDLPFIDDHGPVVGRAQRSVQQMAQRAPLLVERRPQIDVVVGNCCCRLMGVEPAKRFAVLGNQQPAVDGHLFGLLEGTVQLGIGLVA